MVLKTNHYVYKIILEGSDRYYIGRRSTKLDINKDPYLGSGNWVKSIKDKSKLCKIIISVHNTIDELKDAELKLITEHFEDPNNMNYLLSSGGIVVGQYAGDKNPNYGKSFYGIDNPHFGKPHTELAKERMSDARKGKYIGERHPRCTISETTAISIKSKLATGASIKSLMEEYNTTRSVVTNIKRKKAWNHINN